jgi:hypothetical protein
MVVDRIEKSVPKVVSNERSKKHDRSALKDNLRAEIDLMRAARKKAIENHAREVQEKKQRIRLLQARINTLLRDFHKYVAIHNYAVELKVQDMPSYIVILQAKLCRELHRMCAEDNQLKLLRKDVKRLGTFALKQLRDMEQEKSDLEVQVVNGMVKLDAQQKLLREEYNEKVHQQRLQVVDIQKDISQDSRAWEDSRLDNLMDRLSILNTNLKLQTEPQDEITLDDLKADLSKTRRLDQMLKEEKSPASAFHGSWSAIGTVDDDQMLEEDNSACAFHGSWSATGRWM